MKFDQQPFPVKESVRTSFEDSPTKVLESIPHDKRNRIPNEICKMLTENGLSFQQAEMLLEVAKSRLRRAKI